MKTAGIAPADGDASRGILFSPGPGFDSWAAGAWLGALCFFAATSWVSYAHWASFAYRTFDLAFYVQALWQLLHGRFDVSLLNVPLLGNHVEPIVFLLAPLFALCRHPMALVFVQNALLASMAPVAYRIARRLGHSARAGCLLALALLAAPATSYIALHEFHPEAFAAPFLLLLIEARVSHSPRRHWLWFLAVLACKENMALLLVAYCSVHLWMERKRPAAELRRWYGWPLVLALGWFVIATKLILSTLNAGNVDYLALYDRLGSTPGQIVLHAFTQPGRFFTALVHALRVGNLLPALLLPFLGLPILRPRWLLIASPILLQHLLSWRSSEWMIYFHYSAPLLPLVWFAAAEAIPLLHQKPPAWPMLRGVLCLAVLFASLLAQIIVGPAPSMWRTARAWASGAEERRERQTFLAQIPADASLTAPLPYLSHLAMRSQLVSLHFILKGLRTLSRSTYHPPAPTDYVLIDYADAATFDAAAGYYHPTMKTTDGRVIPSSDLLLHEVLHSRSWKSVSRGPLTLLRQEDKAAGEAPSSARQEDLAQFGPHTSLVTATKDREQLAPGQSLTLRFAWRFVAPREKIPWVELALTPADGNAPLYFTCGLAAPEISGGLHQDTWEITATNHLPPGSYLVTLSFFDNPRRLWSQTTGHPDPAALLGTVFPLGRLEVSGTAR